MGDDEKTPLKLDFDSKVRVEFRGATITSDAGLLACRELDDALSLTDSADEFLKESRTGKNILHQLIPLLRQSVYSRLAGYDDTNDADRLSQDPALSLEEPRALLISMTAASVHDGWTSSLPTSPGSLATRSTSLRPRFSLVARACSARSVKPVQPSFSRFCLGQKLST